MNTRNAGAVLATAMICFSVPGFAQAAASENEEGRSVSEANMQLAQSSRNRGGRSIDRRGGDRRSANRHHGNRHHGHHHRGGRHRGSSFGFGLGLGILGGAALAAPYVAPYYGYPAYAPAYPAYSYDPYPAPYAYDYGYGYGYGPTDPVPFGY